MSISIEGLKANSILMEQLEDIRFDQTTKDRIHYNDIVLEAITTSEGQAIMLDKLFKETQKIDGVDFGNIPDTRGDITKFRYYGQLNDCIELINEIVADDSTPNIQTMNRLQQILLDARPDFEFGFKSDNFIITSMYKVMVLSLFEIENVCIVDVTEYLRKRVSISTSAKTMAKMRTVVKNANQFIKMYENGQWSTMLRAFRSGKAYEFAVSHDESMTPATELNLRTEISIDTAKGVAGSAANVVKNTPGAVKDMFKLVGQKYASFKSEHHGLAIAGAIIGAVILALFIIRRGISLFYHGAGNLKKWVKNNAEILKAHLKLQNDNEDAITKQKKMLDSLENIADTIDYNILKTEKESDAEMSKNNRENFTPADFKNINGAEFEF